MERGPAFFSNRLGATLYTARAAVAQVLQLSVEILTSVLIVSLIVAANPIAAVVSVVGMSIPAILIYRALHRRLGGIGRDEVEISEAATGTMLTGVAGIKEIKVSATHVHFERKYGEQQSKLRTLVTLRSLFSSMPRVIVELSAVLAILVLSAVIAYQGRLDQLMAVMGLYAAAAFRLLPSANRIILAMTGLRHNRHGLGLIAEDLRSLPEDVASVIPPSLQNVPREPFQDIEVAHLKMTLTPDAGTDLAVVNLVRNGGQVEASHTLNEPLTDGECVVNLRAEGDPETLRGVLADALASLGVPATVTHSEAFRPGKPVPTHRMVTG